MQNQEPRIEAPITGTAACPDALLASDCNPRFAVFAISF